MSKKAFNKIAAGLNEALEIARGNATASVIHHFRKPLEAIPRDEIVKNMAEHLVAAILHNSLDTSNDIDVIQTLLDTPERYQSRVVLNHMDDAMVEADQMMIARKMSEA